VELTEREKTYQTRDFRDGDGDETLVFQSMEIKTFILYY
jgi:hypothetical protein